MWSYNRDSQYPLRLEILETMCCRTSSIRSSDFTTHLWCLRCSRDCVILLRTIIDQIQVSLKNYSECLYIIDLVKCKQFLSKIHPHPVPETVYHQDSNTATCKFIHTLFQKQFTIKTQIRPPANSSIRCSRNSLPIRPPSTCIASVPW